jgi:hypothetical protein
MAGYNNTSKDVALTAIGAAATFISLHSADPGTTGANEITGGSPAYARVATTWGAAAASSMAGSQVTLNVPASTTIEFWGVWSLVTGGVYYEGGALPANETYGGQGTYLLTPTLTATG